MGSSRLILACSVLALLAGVGFAQTSDYVQYEQLTVAGTAVGITSTTISPAGKPQARACEGRLETAEVRFTFDGTTPTSTVGAPLEPGDVVRFDSAADAGRAKFIRTGATSGVLNIHCWN